MSAVYNIFRKYFRLYLYYQYNKTQFLFYAISQKLILKISVYQRLDIDHTVRVFELAPKCHIYIPNTHYWFIYIYVNIIYINAFTIAKTVYLFKHLHTKYSICSAVVHQMNFFLFNHAYQTQHIFKKKKCNSHMF